MGKKGNLVFFVFLLISLYFVNYALGFFEIPQVNNFDKWIHLIGAVLILFSGFKIKKSME